MRRFSTLVSCVLVLVSSSTGSLAAQDSADADSLARADALAHSGRTEEARTLLLEWWDQERPTASRSEQEHGAWLRALLTVDPEQARIEYRRLVVEFPGGRYSAPGLARIARIAEASGDTTGARTAWETLLREHRGSASASMAREWLDRYSGGSDSGIGVTVAEASEATPVDPVARPAGGDDTLDHAVQLGAFSSLNRASELLSTARAAGLEPRLVRVRDSDLIRVRLGHFGSEAEAEDLRVRVRALGFDALIVDGAAREEGVGGR